MRGEEKAKIESPRKISKEDEEKIQYIEKLSNLQHDSTRQKMFNLMEMGYMDFNLNYALLQQMRGNFEAVIEKLIEKDSQPFGALNRID